MCRLDLKLNDTMKIFSEYSETNEEKKEEALIK